MVKVWDIFTGKAVFEFKGEENEGGRSNLDPVDGISAIEIDKSGKRFALYEWLKRTEDRLRDNDGGRGERESEREREREREITVIISSRLVTGTQNGKLKLWNYNNGHCIMLLDKGTYRHH